MGIVAVLLAFGLLGVVFTTARSASVAVANRQADATRSAMLQVRDALIGWSASRTPTGGTPNARPGELPCPDVNNTGIDPGGCAAGAIGRVPWRSLGIPEPKDSAGETLWYAVAGPFRYFHPTTNPNPITSDTIIGTLTVHSNPGTTTATATTLTTLAVAVIFAPGAAVGAQNRDPLTTALCPTTGTVIARNLCAANYLDIAVGPSGNVANATTNGPFIQGPLRDPSIENPALNPFNDRVLAITNADLMPLVERRVAREMMALLEQYRIARALATSPPGDYPSGDWANGNSDDQNNRHRFPCGSVIPVDWGSGGTPPLPNWLANGCGSNGWTSVIFYAVSKFRLTGNICDTTVCTGGTTCGGIATTTADRLTIINPSNRVADSCPAGGIPYTCTPAVLFPVPGIANLVLITPGAATTNRAGGWPASLTPISLLYFQDADNSDNDSGNCYIVPTSASHNRNRMYVSIP